MRTKGIIGQKIVAIKQSRFDGSFGNQAYAIDWITLEDGTRLMSFVLEPREDGYGVDLIINRTSRTS